MVSNSRINTRVREPEWADEARSRLMAGVRQIRVSSDLGIPKATFQRWLTNSGFRQKLKAQNKDCPTNATGGADQPDKQADPKTQDFTREAV